MQNGIAILEKTDTGTNGFFVDQDTIELSRLNAITQQRIDKAEAERRKAAHNRRMAEREEAKFNAYTLHTIKYIFVRTGVVLAAMWGGMDGIIHPAIWLFITLYCLCAVCVKLGAWFGRAVKQ